MTIHADPDDVFDYVVVGAGSAGCPVAAALSEDPNVRVLLIEAGPHADRFWIDTPAGMAKLYFNKKLNWNYHTEPMTQLMDRRMYWPRGKVLGGSSSINGMIFIRGHRADFDGWAAAGNPGWSYEDVLPHFRSMEHFERRSDAWRGQGGPLWISDPETRTASSFDFIASAKALGHPEVEDMNGEHHDGVGFMQHSIRNGRRQSAFTAFIRPVMGRRNLLIRTETRVERLTFTGRSVTGLMVSGPTGTRRIVARREVILSGGAINTPQILMLSGIGPGAALHRLGIGVVHDNPAVGRNLQDHFYIHTGWRATADSSYNRAITGWRRYLEGFRYLMTRRGYLALGSSQVAAFVKSRPDLDRADLQISFRPMTFDYFPNGTVEVEREPGLGVSVFQLTPDTMGEVTLRSPDPFDKAVCNPQFMTRDSDVEAMLSGIRHIRAIMATRPVADRVVAEVTPGPAAASDEDLVDFMRRTGNSAHHQAGTCRMGPGEGAVVDSRLRVHGIERLRVVDASIMPLITSGNTNAPAMMIGFKGGAMIREDRLPACDATSLHPA